MDVHNSHGEKRKRSPSDAVRTPPHPMPALQAHNTVTHINYLMKAKTEKMRLIDGNSETFGEVLSLIEDYEGILQRHESLASNLGAKLVGPLLLKSLDKLFEGPLKVSAPLSPVGISVTWLDVLDFARTNPNEFVLVVSPRTGTKVCTFITKMCQVEITEDDYRLVLSGAPQRMIPAQPIAEDEVAEVGTIDILEQRLAMLIKKADLVAGRARQLNYHLKQRKQAMQTSRGALQAEQFGPGQQGTDARSPVNSHPIKHHNLEKGGLHQDLLRQFHSDERKTMPSRGKMGRKMTDTPDGSPTAHDQGRRGSQPQQPIDDGTGGQYRPFMTAKVEKMGKGEAIWPPCDRCRRLDIPCAKHLTACVGCTKKHAKCAWKDIKEDEIAYIIQNYPLMDENGDGHNDMLENLDPGLRVNGDGMNGSNNLMSDEHHILSQMASAAAAAGHQ